MFHEILSETDTNHDWNGAIPSFIIRGKIKIIFIIFLDVIIIIIVICIEFIKFANKNDAEAIDWIIKYFITASFE